MLICYLPVKRFMKYLLPWDVRLSPCFFLTAFLLSFTACKKTTITENSVDAFAQVNNEVNYQQGIYNILFTLQEYPYKEVGVRIGTSKNMFYKNTDLSYHLAYQVSLNRYGIFLNSLAGNKIYYYQIYVKDTASSKEVFSDVFSFTTNP
jgi:hypothetical protein